MKTLREKCIDALIARGCQLIDSNQRNYTVLLSTKKNNQGNPIMYFVGYTGSIRYGSNHVPTRGSTPRFKERLLEELNV